MTSRMGSLLIVIGVWAALYLPLLGFSELRGEEGKRVLPAIQMLESGNYVVPYLGARPYLSKPPLINWLVAASFHVFGMRNEWSARLPSALFVLAAALGFCVVGQTALGVAGSTVASLCWLTSLEMIDKGRTIEIDATYASLFAWALILWLTFWQQNRSKWITFTVPWFFLGFGLLAKGPALLFFFYCVLIAVLWQNRRLRELLHPSHWFGVLIMLAIFAGWALPYFFSVRANSPELVWWNEAKDAFHGEIGRSEDWKLNFPRGIAFLLPSIFLLPFVRFHRIQDSKRRAIARGLAWGAAIPFILVLLIPGTLPRYILPLAAPICWLLGSAFASNGFEWQLAFANFHLRFSQKIVGWAFVSAIVAEIVIFPLRSVTLFKRHEVLRPMAARINAATLPGEPLYAIDLPFQPYLFYLHSPVIHLQTLDQLPASAHSFLIQSRDLSQMETTARWKVLQPNLLAQTPEYRTRDTMLFAVTTQESRQ